MLRKLGVLLIFTAIASGRDAGVFLSEETASKLKTHSTRAGKENFIFTLNDIADQIVGIIGPYIVSAGYDPAKLPGFYRDFELDPIYGKLNLTDGILRNASTLRRIADVKFTLEESENVLVLHVPVGFDNLEVSYNYSAQIMGFGPSGRIKGSVSDVSTNTIIKIDLTSSLITLGEFKITESGYIGFTFSESKFDCMFDIVTEILGPFLQDFVVKKVEDIVNEFINNILSQRIHV